MYMHITCVAAYHLGKPQHILQLAIGENVPAVPRPVPAPYGHETYSVDFFSRDSHTITSRSER